MLFLSRREGEASLWATTSSRLLEARENPDAAASEIIEKTGKVPQVLRWGSWRYTDPNLLTVTYVAVVDDAASLAIDRKSGYLLEICEGLRKRSSTLATIPSFSELDVADVALDSIIQLVGAYEKDPSLKLTASEPLKDFWQAAQLIASKA